MKYLCEGLPLVNTDWSKWSLAFCDERVVPEDSEDSTFGTYSRQLIPKTQLTKEQFVVIKQGVSGKSIISFFVGTLIDSACNTPLVSISLILYVGKALILIYHGAPLWVRKYIPYYE